MKIDKYEKTGMGKYRLYLDNGEVLDTYDEIILKNDLLLKKELTQKDYQTILIESAIQEQYNACIKYITVRIRSTKEIVEYLKRRKVADEDIDNIVTKLTKEKFLDDNHFCECFIKDKLRFTTMGKYRIINELKKQGLKQETINQYEDLMSEDIMREKIKKLVEKQIQSNHKLDSQKLRNKLYNHLLNLGYSSSLVVEVLNQRF